MSSDSDKKTRSVKKSTHKESPKTNEGTRVINGVFNVNLAKKKLKSHILDVLQLQELKILKAHIAYSVCAEVVALFIVRASAEFTEKSSRRADLYDVNRHNIQRAIRESKDFGAVIKMASDQYNPNLMNYTTCFFDTRKVLVWFLENNAFANTTNVRINGEIGNDSNALNFICYILEHVLSLLTNTACQMSLYAKKKNIQIKNYHYAIMCHFTGSLQRLLIQRLDEVESLIKDSKKTDDDAEDDVGEEEEEDEEEDDEEAE